MDIRAEFGLLIEEMEWSEVLDVVQAMLVDMGDTTQPPTLATPPPHPLYSGCSPLGAAPHSFTPITYQEQSVMQNHRVHHQQGVCSQGQSYNIPVLNLPDSTKDNLVPIGMMNREVVFGLTPETFPPVAPVAPPSETSRPKKRKRVSQQEKGETYVKKPPNAFMLFMKEQRLKVVAELNNRNNATVTAVLGQKWKSLSRDEQTKYYEAAEKEKKLHAQLFPDWSCSQNYGKKRKRMRRKAETTAKAPASEAQAVIQPSSSQTHEMEPPSSSAHMMEPSSPETQLMESFTLLKPPVCLSLCDTIDLLEWDSINDTVASSSPSG